MTKRRFPFMAIMGQEELSLALIFNLVNPQIGGVLIRGTKGTGKSTQALSLSSHLVLGLDFNAFPTRDDLRFRVISSGIHVKGMLKTWGRGGLLADGNSFRLEESWLPWEDLLDSKPISRNSASPL